MATHDARGLRQEGDQVDRGEGDQSDQGVARAARSEDGAAGNARDAYERVSVVIPAHNEAGYIEAALASVIAQDYPLERLECVVVDNASTDGTARVAQAFAARHDGLCVRVVTEPSLGVSRAKNRGARHATGAILIFLDADSIMALSLTRDIVGRYHAGAPAGSIRVVADSDSRLERGFFDLVELGARLFGIRSQMFYCDRALFLALDGFDESLRLAEDLELLRRVKARLRRKGSGRICHIRSSVIATSPRRLRARPYHLSLVAVFARWALAFAGVGRKREYGM
ncbi:MAG TPA: glycosyltransferase [Ktedonobacterales bacterium]|nr:glycosyltransferase [Ktedonobacterales bacterium]